MWLLFSLLPLVIRKEKQLHKKRSEIGDVEYVFLAIKILAGLSCWEQETAYECGMRIDGVCVLAGNYGFEDLDDLW